MRTIDFIMRKKNSKVSKVVTLVMRRLLIYLLGTPYNTRYLSGEPWNGCKAEPSLPYPLKLLVLCNQIVIALNRGTFVAIRKSPGTFAWPW